MQQPGEVTRHALYPATSSPAAARTSWRALGVQFVLGVLFGLGFVSLADRLGNLLDGFSLVAMLLAFPVAFWLQLLVHEAGHALGGLLAGRRFVGAGAGPFRLERGEGRWMLRWGGGVRGIGGFAAMLPARSEGRLASAVFLLGGPLANLATAVLAAVALASLQAPGPYMTAVLGSFAFAGGLLCLANLVPFSSSGWSSDGRQLVELVRGGPAWRATRAYQSILAAAMAGIRPRDWPIGTLAEAQDAPAGLEGPLQVLRMSMALDRDDRADADEAAAALAALWPGAADGQRQGIALMLASYAARCGDASLLAAWRPHCEGGLLDLTPYRLWLDAESALHAGDPDAGRSLLAQARDALPRVHDRSSQQVLGEYLDGLGAALDGAVPRPRTRL